MHHSTFTIYIPKGTKVQRDDSAKITLAADVMIDDAVAAPECGGGFIYTCGGRRYYTCTPEAVGGWSKANDVDVAYGWQHPNGLVTFV